VEQEFQSLLNQYLKYLKLNHQEHWTLTNVLREEPP